MATSSPSDLGVIRPERCALVTDSGARVNEVVDRATINVRGGGEVEYIKRIKTYDQSPFPGRMPGSRPCPALYQALECR